MVEELLTIETEIRLSGSEYRLYKLRTLSTTQLRNMYQDLLNEENNELCSCIRIIMIERNSNL